MYLSVDIGGTSTRIALSDSLETVTISAKSSCFSNHISKFKTTVGISDIIFGGGVSDKQKNRILQLNQEDIAISDLGEDTGLFGGFGLLRTNLK